MNEKAGNKYDDIIDLPHHVSQKHPQMSREKRAAQFAPFAALTGFEDAIMETEKQKLWQVEMEVLHEDYTENC